MADYFKPMKGVEFTDKRLEQWLCEDGSVIVQPKRDEIRCVVTVDLSKCIHDDLSTATVTYKSATGKPLYNLQCFDVMWVHVSHFSGHTVFDCGCMVDSSFDVTRSVLRSSKKEYDLSKRAVFFIYDLPEALYRDYESRVEEITDLVMDVGYPAISTPYSYEVSDPSRVYTLYEAYLEKGHEGAMVKRVNHMYRNGRSTDWMKMKPRSEVDCLVTGYIPGKGKYDGLVGALKAVDADGQELAFSGFSDADRADITTYIDQYVGRIAEVRYMQRDSQGGYRHPRFYRWHPDKDTL